MSEPRQFGLFVGINYPGTSSQLSGCVNDANDHHAAFNPFCERAMVLLDHDATKENITTALKDFIGQMHYRDTLLFTYSGHGSWVPDMNNDEPDGRDEVLCPVDFRNGMLVDDELDAIFEKRKYGSRIVFISDSCFSGSVYKMAGSQQDEQKRIRFLPPDEFLEGQKRSRAIEIAERVMLGTAKIAKKDKPRSGIITLSGCLDHEYSYDAWFGDRANGAFTYNLLECWRALPANGTYEQLMKAVSQRLPSFDYPQTPRLGATTTYARKVVLGKE